MDVGVASQYKGGWMGGCMVRDLYDVDIIIIENNINLSYVYTI